VAIGRGQCVVDDDGLVVPVSKCSMKELRAEAAARGAANAADMKRPELTAMIKVGGAALLRSTVLSGILHGDLHCRVG
jgi:hypothetical protein